MKCLKMYHLVLRAHTFHSAVTKCFSFFHVGKKKLTMGRRWRFLWKDFLVIILVLQQLNAAKGSFLLPLTHSYCV